MFTALLIPRGHERRDHSPRPRRALAARNQERSEHRARARLAMAVERDGVTGCATLSARYPAHQIRVGLATRTSPGSPELPGLPISAPRETRIPTQEILDKALNLGQPRAHASRILHLHVFRAGPRNKWTHLTQHLLPGLLPVKVGGAFTPVAPVKDSPPCGVRWPEQSEAHRAESKQAPPAHALTGVRLVQLWGRVRGA